MKKFLSIFIAFIITFIPFCIPASAGEIADNKQTEYFEDGSYITVEISSVIENEMTNIFARIFEFFRKLIEFFTGNKTVSKTKYASYYDSKGALLWSVYLTAEFSYNGKTAKCKSSAASYDVYDSDWKVTSAVSSKEENTANADFTVQQTKLGVKLKPVTKRLTLTCDEGGEVV